MIQVDVVNYWKQEECVYLLNHEEVCPKCKGHGILGAFNAEALFVTEQDEIEAIANKRDATLEAIALVFCNSCDGEGKVDWIRRIRGSELERTISAL